MKTLSSEEKLNMATEEHYRERAACYRCSAEYDRMVHLYPILETTIKDCLNETLVN